MLIININKKNPKPQLGDNLILKNTSIERERGKNIRPNKNKL
jgi:hypothetical protein